MIIPEQMTKIRIVTSKSHAYSVINALYSLNLLHVKEYERGKLAGLDKGSPLSNAEQLSKSLLTLRAIKSALNIENKLQTTQPKTFSEKELANLNRQVEQLHSQTSEIKNKIKENEEQLTKLNNKSAALNALKRIGIKLKELKKIKFLVTFIGTIKESITIKKKLDVVLKSYELKHTAINGEKIIALFVKKDDEFKARAILNEAGFINLPLEQYQNLELNQLKKQIKKTENELSKLKSVLSNIKNKHRQFLLQNEIALEHEIMKAELPLNFATTKSSFIASGFIPAKQLYQVKQSLTDTTNGRILIEEEHLSSEEQEEVPVKLNNPKPIRNFEVLTRLYELPKYFEVDPSILIALTFPIFFGIMLGDVGYGIVTLILFTLLKKKFKNSKEARQLLNVLVYASILTIAFGFVFGEYLGFEHVSEETGEKLCSLNICFHKETIIKHGESEIVYSFPRLISRLESKVNIFGVEILAVLFLSIIIGIIHINFGILIGFYNIMRAHGLKHAILEKLSWIVLEFGLVLMVLSLINLIALSVWLGVAIILISLIMLYLGEGIKGLIELPAIFSNTLSYMRLGAVGLSSVSLAFVINDVLAKPFLHKGGFYIVIALLIMLIGHIINIALGIIGPFLHGIRLHYVEFFSKFFHGGGQEYKPFGYKTGLGGE